MKSQKSIKQNHQEALPAPDLFKLNEEQAEIIRGGALKRPGDHQIGW